MLKWIVLRLNYRNNNAHDHFLSWYEKVSASITTNELLNRSMPQMVHFMHHETG